MIVLGGASAALFFPRGGPGPSSTSSAYSSSSTDSNSPESCRSSPFFDQCAVYGLGLQPCGTGNSFFTTSPFHFSDFTNIIPLGLVDPPDHIWPAAQIYFNLKADSQGVPVNATVVSPGNLTIYAIQSNTWKQGNSTWHDVFLHFAVCDHVFGQFYTLSGLSGAVLDSFTPPFDSCSNFTMALANVTACFKSIDVKVTAGEAIAKAGGGWYSSEIDFRLQDYRIPPLSFANDSMLAGEGESYPLNTVCPLDYFTPALKTSLYSLLGGFNSSSQTVTRRTTSPLCGSIDQDIPGTAQGIWFIMNSTGVGGPGWDDSLALIHNNVDPSQPVFSVGTTMSAKGFPSSGYYFTATSSGSVNKDFGNVTADGQVYCYQSLRTGPSQGNSDPQHIILLQLVNPSLLRIEMRSASGCGSGPWSFTSNHTDFRR